MIEKMEKNISKMPLWILTVLWIVFAFIRGCLNTLCMVEQSRLPDSIIKGYFFNQITVVIILNVIHIIALTTSNIFWKTHRLKRLNKYYVSLQKKQFTTDIGNLMSTNIGKLTSDIDTYVIEKVGIMESVLDIFVEILPLLVIIKKLFIYVGVFPVLVNLSFIIIFGVIFKILNGGEKLKRIQNSNRAVKSVSYDNMMNIKVLRYLSQGEFATKRLENFQKLSVKENVAIFRQFGLSFFYCAPFIALLYNMFILRNCKDITLLVFVCSESYGCLFSVSKIIAVIIDSMQKFKVASDNIKFLNNKTERKEKPIKHSIKISHCKFGYPDSDIIFEANFEMKKGKRYSISGESGQGKSTIANLLVGNLKPIYGNCPEVKTYYIHQDTEILDSSLRDNLCFGKNIPDNELLDLINQIGLKSWFNSLKDGFETILGDRGNKVSSGQKQRINILRAVIKMKELDLDTLIILDEPTSNLDNNTEKLAVKLIDKYCKNTLLVITHRPLIEGICDYKYEVKNHKLITK